MKKGLTEVVFILDESGSMHPLTADTIGGFQKSENTSDIQTLGGLTNLKDNYFCEKNKKDIRVIYHTLESTYQKAGLVRYDAFPQMGGKLSFTLALLNEKDNGFIINSVHGTDGCYTYSKEIIGGQCEITLGKEEQEALNKAIDRG